MKAYLSICVFAVLFIFSNCDRSDYDEPEINDQSEVKDCYQTFQNEFKNCLHDGNCEQQAVRTFISCKDKLFTFPINIVVLTNKLKGTDKERLQLCENVVDTLNRYFTAEDSRFPPDNRNSLVSFKYKSATLYKDVIKIGGNLVEHASPNFVLEERNEFQKIFNQTNNTVLRDPNAINVYIIDMKRKGEQEGSLIESSWSHGRNNRDRPYLVLDYARLSGKSSRVGAEEHEMGHCFNLAHVCEPGTSGKSDTNIMATGLSAPIGGAREFGKEKEAECMNGSSGKRNIGFDPRQCEVILRNAVEIAKELDLPTS